MSGADSWAFVPRGVSVGPTRKVTTHYALVPSPLVDQPSKRYLLEGPPLEMKYMTFKTMQILNQVLAMRVAELNEQGELTANM